jgi:hypothetical protein
VPRRPCGWRARSFSSNKTNGPRLRGRPAANARWRSCGGLARQGLSVRGRQDVNRGGVSTGRTTGHRDRDSGWWPSRPFGAGAVRRRAARPPRGPRAIRWTLRRDTPGSAANVAREGTHTPRRRPRRRASASPNRCRRHSAHHSGLALGGNWRCRSTRAYATSSWGRESFHPPVHEGSTPSSREAPDKRDQGLRPLGAAVDLSWPA